MPGFRRQWTCVLALALALAVAFEAAAQTCDPPGAAGKGPGSFNSPKAFAPSGAYRVRKSVTKLSAFELGQLKKAYQLLRALPASDPRSWQAQANVHCYYCGSREEIHGTWNFLPWHRAYLYFHERILSELLHDPNFALPYWDWPNEPKLPAPYATGALVDPKRAPGRTTRTNSLADQFTGPGGVAAAQAAAMGQPDFFLFGGGLDPAISAQVGGALESSPHGAVHVWVGDPASSGEDMGVFATAARDPLFFAHHANIDRLWDVWRAMPNHPNPTAADFLNASWRFVDYDGKWVRIAARDLLDDRAKLHYSYNDDPRLTARKLAALSPRRPAPAPSPKGVKSAAGSVVLSGAGRLQARPNIYKAALGGASAAPKKFSGSGPSGGAAILRVEGIEAPSNKSELVRIFVGMPAATAATPLRDKHFVGYLSSVAKSRGAIHVHRAANLAVAISPALKAELASRREAEVTLVPVDANGKAARNVEVSFKKIWISELGSAPPADPCPKPERLEVARFGQYQPGVETLPPDQQQILRSLGARIARGFGPGCQPLTVVELVGHADFDPRKTRAFELDVSKKRAAAVRDALAKAIGPNARRVRFVVSGVGSKDLKHKNAATDALQRENRRVLIATKVR
jgi:polyphenol oxidase